MDDKVYFAVETDLNSNNTIIIIGVCTSEELARKMCEAHAGKPLMWGKFSSPHVYSVCTGRLNQSIDF